MKYIPIDIEKKKIVDIIPKGGKKGFSFQDLHSSTHFFGARIFVPL
jgi:hypothetical protein